jgi:hypothetical protein
MKTEHSSYWAVGAGTVTTDGKDENLVSVSLQGTTALLSTATARQMAALLLLSADNIEKVSGGSKEIE